MNREPLTFDEYQTTGFYPALDGLRAISCILIITWHATFLGWQGLNGFSGVLIFFVLSGYLITTLALREEARRGALSLKAFYVRRAFRIFPAYYAVLALYCVIIFALPMASSVEKREPFLAALPYYLTYFNEYSSEPIMEKFGVHPAFFHSWSLGIEEKFYLLWPLLAFVLLRKYPNGRIVVPALLIAFEALFGGSLVALALQLYKYVGILVGCILAVLMERPKSYRILALFATNKMQVKLFIVFLVTQVSIVHGESNLFGHIYPYVVALLLVSLVAGRGWCTALLSRPLLTVIGRRAYGMYLLHLLALNAIELVFKPGDLLPLWKSPLYFLASLAVVMIAAECLYRGLEKPCIAWGHRLSRRILAPPDSPQQEASQEAN